MRKVVKYRLENVRDDDVFWCEMVLDGPKLKVTYGSTNKSTNETRIFERAGDRYSSPEAAEAAVKKILESNRGQNYKSQKRTEEMVPGVGDDVAPHASNPELEAQLASATDDKAHVAAATVYADWLQTQNDVRGELAALWLGGKQDGAREWVATNATKLFGALDVKLDIEVYDLVWKHGFLVGASLKRVSIDSNTDLGAMTREFLALPVARFVTALRFGLESYESDNDWSSTMTAVAESPQAATLRSLRFDDYHSEDCEISWTAFGDFSDAWRSFPVLEELVIRSGEGGNLGEIDLPNLRTFRRISGGLSGDEIRSILSAKWPKLEHLEIWFGSEDYGASGNISMLGDLFGGSAPSTLRHLGLCNAQFAPEIVAALVRSPLLARLSSIDLSGGVLMDSDADVLIANAAKLAHLSKIDLSENLLNERMDDLKKALPNAIVDDQRYDGEDYRYVALGE
jgi:hypothetical protein